MQEQFQIGSPQFQSPEEELKFLREQLSKREAELGAQQIEKPREDVASALVAAYKEAPKAEVLHPTVQSKPEDHEGVVLKLSPEKHDEQTAEFMGIMMEKGVKNTLDTIAAMNNPHLDDDFHRFLVQYLVSYKEVPGLKPNQELYKSIDTTLFEITLPSASDDGKDKGFKEMIALMEQFYAGMQALGSGDNPEKNHFTLEIAVQNIGEEIIFYASVPRHRADLFEKQILGLYHHAKIAEVTNDYNIFSDGGSSVGMYGASTTYDILSVKTYDKFEQDPLEVLLNAFSKIKKDGEGVALQFVIRPAGDKFLKQYGKVLDSLKKGEKLKDLFATAGAMLGKEAKAIGGALLGAIFGGGEKEEKKDDKKLDDDAISNITEKLKSTIVETNIRIIASAENDVRAQALASDISSAFNQFTDPQGTGIKFESVKPKELRDFLHQFSYRLFDESERIALSFKELATVFHVPASIKGSGILKQAKSNTAPAPLEMGTTGIFLGENDFRGKKTPIYFQPADRLRHFYTIGQTGVGKTQLFLKMIIQDIKNGDGCCFIDPHGTDVQTILANIPPERMDDVIYFDPANLDRPMGLNMMEFDERFPIQKTLVTAELLSIFDKLFDMKAQGGAMFGQYFRNAALLNMEDPASGNTMLEITRVLSDKAFREMKLSKCKNPIISAFWKSAEATKGEQSLEQFVPYISSKFDDFISNEIMRPIVLQEKSAFNFRKVMDEKKILLVNLSKGLLGEKNASLIGLVLVGKLQMAALSRADNPNLIDFPPFYMYIDEFQNVTTDSIESILSEARKYKLSLNITHQYLDQLEDNIKAAVFGNVGSMAFFRVKSEDAAYAEPRVAPTFTKDDIIKLDNGQAVASMLIGGKPGRAFNLDT